MTYLSDSKKIKNKNQAASQRPDVGRGEISERECSRTDCRRESGDLMGAEGGCLTKQRIGRLLKR